MVGPAKARRTAPVWSAMSSRGHRINAVAFVQGRLSAQFQFLDAYLAAGQVLGLLHHPGTRCTARRGEHRDEPRLIGAVEVVAVELSGDRAGVRCRRRVLPSTEQRSNQQSYGDTTQDQKQAVHAERRSGVFGNSRFSRDRLLEACLWLRGSPGDGLGDRS